MLHELLDILKLKPWLILWPVLVVSWVLGDDAPWWLRLDLTTSDEERRH